MIVDKFVKCPWFDELTMREIEEKIRNDYIVSSYFNWIFFLSGPFQSKRDQK